MSLLAPSTGFQHRRFHYPSPLDVRDPSSKHASATGPLTPPLTSSSTLSTDSDGSTRSLHIPAADLPIPSFDSCGAFQQVPKWPSSPEQSALPSPTSPTNSYRELDLSQPTHFLFVSGVPKCAPTHALKQAFGAYGDLKGIFVRFQADHGTIILAFYDIRHAHRVHHAIRSPSRPFVCSPIRLAARFVTPEELHGLIGYSPFVDATNSTLRILTFPAGQGGELDGPALQSVLASFGDLRVFTAVNTRTYHVEFFDGRDATSVLCALNGHVIRRQCLHIVPYFASALDPPFVPADFSPPKHEDANEDADLQNKNTVSFPSSSPVPSSRRCSVDSSLPTRSLHASPALVKVRTRRMSNIYLFDSTGKPAILHTPLRPRSISSLASDNAGLGIIDVSSSCSAPPPISSSSSLSSPSASPPSHHYTPFVVESSLPLAHQATGPMMRCHADLLSERNGVDLAMIERGDDTRTTVMIRNIPNKMSDKDLINFINDVCPRKIDFLYLRIDFANGCNVGYAFVNFIHVQDLLHFSKLKLGTKWNLFSSEKILGMSYATYQGKAALMDKFRSSYVMDQRESWRPKIFYSAGPKQGLPEDFPASTHVRRKMRSTHVEIHHGGQGRTLFNA